MKNLLTFLFLITCLQAYGQYYTVDNNGIGYSDGQTTTPLEAKFGFGGNDFAIIYNPIDKITTILNAYDGTLKYNEDRTIQSTNYGSRNSFNNSNVDYNPETNTLYLADFNRVYIKLNDGSNDEPLEIIQHDERITSIAYDSTANRILYTDDDKKKVFQFNLNTNTSSIFYETSGFLALVHKVCVDNFRNEIVIIDNGADKVLRYDFNDVLVAEENVTIGDTKDVEILDQAYVYISEDQNAIIKIDKLSLGADTLVNFGGRSYFSSLAAINDSEFYYYSNRTGESRVFNLAMELDMPYKVMEYEIYGFSSTGFYLQSDSSINIIPGDFGDLGLIKYDIAERRSEYIREVDLSSSTFENVAFDPLSGDLYYNNGGFELTISSMDGSKVDFEVPFDLFDFDSKLQYDPINDFLYYTKGNDINRLNIASQESELFLTAEGNVGYFDFDFVGNRIFFTSDGKLNYKLLDGDDIVPFFSLIDNNYRVQMDKENNAIIVGDKYKLQLDGSSLEEFSIDPEILIIPNGRGLAPLGLTTLEGTNTDQTIEITWSDDQFRSGRSNTYFVIEKQNATSNFDSIGVVSYESGVKSYSYSDENPEAGINSYRLIFKRPDIISYSDVLDVDFSTGTSEVMLSEEYFQYSSQDNLVRILQGEGELTLLDMKGSKLYSLMVTSQQSEYQVPDTFEGIGVLVFRLDSGRVLSSIQQF